MSGEIYISAEARASEARTQCERLRGLLESGGWRATLERRPNPDIPGATMQDALTFFMWAAGRARPGAWNCVRFAGSELRFRWVASGWVEATVNGLPTSWEWEYLCRMLNISFMEVTSGEKQC